MEEKVIEALCEAEDAGDTFVPAPDLYELGDRDRVREVIHDLVHQGRLHRDEGAELYRPAVFRDEVAIAQRVADLRGRTGLVPVPELNGLTELQRRAVAQVFGNGISLILGGPGTGKTTCLKALAGGFPGLVALAAPTGRAAKRLSEAVGREAQTVHRLLRYGPDGFRHGEQSPLPADLVVVDEASMLDVEVAAALLRALKPGARLVLVGDADQLPSVGPGQVLFDLIRSDLIPYIRLKRLHRQKRQSAIALRAAQLRGGRGFDLADADGFSYAEARGDQALDLTVRRAVDLIRRSEEVQVLAPTRWAVAELNRRLQAILNPHGGEEITGPDAVFRAGDRVIFGRNDYIRDFRNGQTGAILAVNPRSGIISVSTEDRAVEVYREELDPDEDGRVVLSHGWAITVHKSQGSEYRHVVVCVPGRSRILSREILYTAITRAKKDVLLVGDREAIRAGAKIIRRRNTKLLTRLRRTVG